MSAAIPILSEALNNASNDVSGASMKRVQIFKRSQSTSTDPGNIIKSSVAVSSTTNSAGAFPTENNASFVVNAPNTEANRITEVVRGNQLTKGQSGFTSLSSAISQSLGNKLFATSPDADILIKSPVLNQNSASGIQTTYGIDKVTASKMADSSFAANSVTSVQVGTTQITNTTVGKGQKLSILLSAGRINSTADDLDAAKVVDRIKQVQEAKYVTEFNNAILANITKIQSYLIPGTIQNGGIAQALSQNIDIVLNTINTNTNTNANTLIANLKNDLVNPVVNAVLNVINTDAVNNVLPLSSQTDLKTSVYATYFGSKVFGNFSSTGTNEGGYGTTSNVYYGAAPTFIVTNDVLNDTGSQSKMLDFTYNAVVNGGGG